MGPKGPSLNQNPVLTDGEFELHDQRSGDVGRGGSHEGRSSSFASIAEESELTHNQDLPTGFADRLVHQPPVVAEHSQSNDLRAEGAGVFGSVGVTYPDQYE